MRRTENLSTDKKPAINLCKTKGFFQLEIVDGIKNGYQLIFWSDPKSGSDLEYCLAKSMQLEGVYVSFPNKYFHAFQVSVIASSLFPCSFLLSEWVYGYMCLLKLEGISSYVVYLYFLFTEFEYLGLQFQNFLLSVSQRPVVWLLG